MSLFDLFDWTKALIERFGYVGIFLGTFLESVFPPIPSEVIMGFSGFLVSERVFSGWGVIVAALAGNIASASLIWWLGRRYGRDFLVRWGKYIGVTIAQIEKGERLFQRHGYKMVFFCQMVPLARSWIAFPAGVLQTKYLKFILVNSAGAAIWLSVLCYLGYVAGDNWSTISDTLKPFERVIVGLVGLIGLIWIYRLVRSKQQLNS